MTTFEPHTGILPEPQQWLWPKLSSIGRNFVLYGGTAVALRYAHRQSVDFDFFTHQAFDSDELKSNLDCLFRNGVGLAEAVGAALALYPDFPTAVALRALCYFDDGDVATIPEAMKQRLRALAAEFGGESPMMRESLCLGD